MASEITLVKAIADNFRAQKVTLNVASKIYDTIVETARTALLKEGTARLSGLGTLTVKQRHPTKRFDIKQKKVVEGTPYKTVGFKAHSELKEELANSLKKK
eukprot:EC719665.1.p1 GENE.EC719665.1~~EC719665.1.p1  ORF type:complete len:101 (+),score=34.34 EC719665.1:35-337(+)